MNAAAGWSGDNMSVKDAAKFLLRLFVQQSSSVAASAGVSDSLSLKSLLLAVNKQNAGLSLTWLDAVMQMCSVVYERAREQPPADLTTAAGVSGTLLTLLVINWACLMNHQVSHAEDVQQLAITIEGLFLSLTRALERPNLNNKSSVISSLLLDMAKSKQLIGEVSSVQLAVAAVSGLYPPAEWFQQINNVL